MIGRFAANEKYTGGYGSEAERPDGWLPFLLSRGRVFIPNVGKKMEVFAEKAQFISRA